MMNSDKILNIITRYLNNEASDHEVKILNDWCADSDDNKKEFIRLREIWILSNKEIEENIKSSQPKVWNNILLNISRKNLRTYTRHTLIKYISIAAVAAILLTLSVNLIIDIVKLPTYHYTEMVIPKGEKGQLLLPDGTKVWLNSGSKITTDNLFNTRNRTVRLEGEAYFDVAKNEKHKFIVETGPIDIIVHGTAFKVAAYPERSDICVSLQRGNVGIWRHDENRLLCNLLPNQEVTINKNSYASNIYNFNSDDYISWTFDELVFEYESVEDVFSKMENWYGVNIHIVSPPDNLKYRFKIKTETLTEILGLLNKMAPIEYTVNGKEVTIVYK